MIALQAVQARSGGGWRTPAVLLTDVTFNWESGVLAVLGSPHDGTTVLLEVLAGHVPVRAGRATIGGQPVTTRSQVAYVPLEPSLPEALTVAEVCALASQLRGERSKTAAARLAPLGIERLADRRVHTLAPGEVRAVALSIALTSEAPVLLVDEPLAGLEPSTPSRVVAAIRARAGSGAAVIVTTASVRDATRLADQLGVLTRGVFGHLPPSLAHVGHAGARLRVVVAAGAVAEASPFVAALARDAAIASIETSAFAASRHAAAGAAVEGAGGAVAVLVSGPDLLALARAVGTAAAQTRTDVEAIESAVMPLDAIRAAVGWPRGGVLPSLPPPAASAPSARPAPPAPSAPPASGEGA